MSQLEPAIKGLLTILDSYEKKSKKKITVVFDGKKREGNNTKEEKFNNISVMYSVSKTADDVIMKYIKENKTPADISVVTSDKQIISYVKRRRSKVILSENFHEILSETLYPSETKDDNSEETSEVQLTEDEINFWENLFSG